MKRVNVHIPQSALDQLDALSAKLKEGQYWRTSYYNRADLIRYAIQKAFGIQTGYAGSLETRLEEIAKQAKPTKKIKK
jgi:Arc/MetJ-type ribon-helix-helix transcriptional regulator